ncbi:hypothetical protein BD410DRAFT_490320 [Rickenella mellea]|uniref:Uncharacterized protein n=1 Tax=Rickenella mellea TaxID=50990 RepID=A0A4Y7PVU7_9AGAM|nr:hypothetical protein BD410DRAFT_490320 [Rickenella mellea]
MLDEGRLKAQTVSWCRGESDDLPGRQIDVGMMSVWQFLIFVYLTSVSNLCLATRRGQNHVSCWQPTHVLVRDKSDASSSVPLEGSSPR